jgi:hypothetical protein
MLKLYWALWAIIAFIALTLVATGNFTPLALIGFGFVTFGMIFMGMIAVLPTTIHHHAPAQEPVAKPAEVKEEREDRIFHAKHLATR